MSLSVTSVKLATLEEQLSSPRQIALARIDDNAKWRMIGGGADCGLPSQLVSLLSDAYQASLDDEKKCNTTDALQEFCIDERTQTLFHTISFLAKVSRLDDTLGEEISRAGSQMILKRLVDRIKEYITVCETAALTATTPEEELLDKLIEYLDLTCELYTPMMQSRGMPFTNEEIESRLPLVYYLGGDMQAEEVEGVLHKKANNPTMILISQVTLRQSSQGDVGFVMWPSALILSRWLISNPHHMLGGKSVLEIGAGCGLVGIAAARLIAQSDGVQNASVTITDVNDLVLDNLAKNILLNDVSEVACVAKLDFYEQTGDSRSGRWTEGFTAQYKDPVDVVLAADIICQPSDSIAAAKTIYDALVPNGRAFVVCADSEHRWGIEIFQEECERVGLAVTATNVADLRGDLLSGCHNTSGYVNEMKFTFYDIQKR